MMLAPTFSASLSPSHLFDSSLISCSVGLKIVTLETLPKREVQLVFVAPEQSRMIPSSQRFLFLFEKREESGSTISQ